MAKDQIGLAIRIVMGRVSGSSPEGAAALRRLIREAQIKLSEIDAELAAKAAISVKARTPSPYLIAKREQQTQAAKAAIALYDSVKMLGRAVGDIWYHELNAMRSESAFAASLADQLLRHGRPSQPTRIRDFVNQKTLASMIKKAEQSAKAPPGQSRAA